MRTLVDYLAEYAAYHRDERNILTHFVGIPMIVLAVVILLSRPVFPVGDWSLTPAMLVVTAAGLFYLYLDRGLGLIMGGLLLLCLWAAHAIAAETTGAWLAQGLGLFVTGWVFQFVGHYYEGRKPAFVDDLMGLVTGPLFVVAEVLFRLGLRTELEQIIEQRVGPVRRTPQRT